MHQLALGAATLLRAPLAAGANVEGWTQLGELGLSLALSALIGLEREFRAKAAGLRTYTLVGVGAALFMLISKYAFTDVLGPHVTVDPSRVAAQIVTGIGFLGAGVIFVQRGSVRGLTTAAAIWVTAAIGAAAGAGLPVLATAAAAVYFLVTLAFPLLTRRMPRSPTAVSQLHVRYLDGRGILRQVLAIATTRGFVIDELSAQRAGEHAGGREPERGGAAPLVEVTLHIFGRGSIDELTTALADLPGVDAVRAGDVNVASD